ncbi:hypothetical protein D6C98_10813 [Aureobasidium pullulans]|nr:hypothetical protein D6C98_10813 [Aureobasidium pullulans]
MEDFKMMVKRNKSRRCRQGSNASFSRTDAANAAKNVSTVISVDDVTELDVIMDFDKDLGWSDQSYDYAEFNFDLGSCSVLPDSVQISSTSPSLVQPETLGAAPQTRECIVRDTDFGAFDTLNDDMMILMAPENVTNKSTALPTPLSNSPSASASGPISSGGFSGCGTCCGTELRAPPLLVPSLPLPGLTADDQSTWHYYTKTIFPSMLHFMLQDATQHMCARAVQSELDSSLCSKQIIPKVKWFQASELRRFGLKGPADRISGQESRASTSAPGEYDGSSLDCLLHVLFAQILLGENEWSNVFQYLSQSVSVQGICQRWGPRVQVLSFLEILASTITGNAPTFAVHHLALIDDSAASDCVIGVEQWLLHCLIRVIDLRNWKQEHLSKASLSMTELIATALSIDDDLKQGRICDRSDRGLGDSVRSSFMKVFESASAVFLQCTLSDSRPEIVEIQREVTLTIGALDDLPQAALLRRLSWPVCIAASMAIVPAQQEFFRRLHTKVNMVWGPDENICRALRVAFECWQLRENLPAGRTCDWLDGMKSLGYFLLLF